MLVFALREFQYQDGILNLGISIFCEPGHVEISDVGEQDSVFGDATHVEIWDAMSLGNSD
jgi:hypothetical protein